MILPISLYLIIGRQNKLFPFIIIIVIFFLTLIPTFPSRLAPNGLHNHFIPPTPQVNILPLKNIFPLVHLHTLLHPYPPPLVHLLTIVQLLCLHHTALMSHFILERTLLLHVM